MAQLLFWAAMNETITERCEAKGLRMTGQRRVIAETLETSDDHPDVEELFARASTRDPNISIATRCCDAMCKKHI